MSIGHKGAISMRGGEILTNHSLDIKESIGNPINTHIDPVCQENADHYVESEREA